MKKIIIALLALLVLCISLAFIFICQNRHKNEVPSKLVIKSVLKNNVDDWDIKLTPIKSGDKWLYDVQVTYLKNKEFQAKVRPPGIYTYGFTGPQNEPFTIEGRYDYEGTDFPPANNMVYTGDDPKIVLDWIVKGSTKKQHGEATFKLIPRY